MRTANADGQPFVVTFVCVCFGVILTVGGCSRDTTGLGTLYEVTGSVSFKGSPTPGAVVELVTKEEATQGSPHSRDLDAPRTFGVVTEDGKFSVKTMVPEGAKTGAKSGEYLISVTWAMPLYPDDKDSTIGPNRLPKKYEDPKTSTLNFNVASTRNVMPPIVLEP